MLRCFKHTPQQNLISPARIQTGEGNTCGFGCLPDGNAHVGWCYAQTKVPLVRSCRAADAGLEEMPLTLGK